MPHKLENMMTSEPLETGTAQHLVVEVDGERYGFDIDRVLEIKAWQGCTPVPHTPACLSGLINFRGTIVPVFDLRRLLDKPVGEYGRSAVVVLKVVADKPRIVAVVVDAVSDVLNDSGEVMLLDVDQWLALAHTG